MQLPSFFAPAIFLAALASSASALTPKDTGFALSSPDFVDGGKLPAEFTCDGNRASPSLVWKDPPAGTKAFAVVMHHIPGPGDEHVYLLLYNIPSDARKVDKNAKDVGSFGVNTVNGKAEYTPPCSKGPGPKTYTLTLYALSAEVKFDKPAVTREMLLAAIKDKTLASTAMNITYERKAKAGADPADQGPPKDGPGGPPDQQGPDQNRPPRRGPGGPPELQRAIKALTLTDAQKAKVDAIVEQFHKAQEQARADLLKQMKEVLDAKQYESLETTFKQPPPRPPEGGPGSEPGNPGDGPPPPPN